MQKDHDNPQNTFTLMKSPKIMGWFTKDIGSMFMLKYLPVGQAVQDINVYCSKRMTDWGQNKNK